MFVDAFEEPGQLLYRFDAVIANQGGTLDLFRGRGRAACSRRCGRAACRRRRRSRDVTPTGPEVQRPLGLRRRLRVRVREDARALPLLLGRALRAAAARAGPRACPTRSASACSTPTRPRRATTSATRSRARRGDVVRVQRPGPGDGADGPLAGRRRRLQRAARDAVGRHHRPRARARRRCGGQANPLLCVLESDETNNTTSAAREIPGVRAGRRDAARAAACSTLSGTVVAPDVPARRSGGCVPGRDLERLLRLGVGGGAADASGSCASPRTAPWRWRPGRTGCTRRRPTRRPRASRARTPSPTPRPTRAG